MENNIPLVSIIIPCRNEEKFIGKCLNSVLTQDYPQNQMEILVADGRSIDGTRKILDNYVLKFPLVRWLDNPKMIVPSGLNILIRQAKGEIIIRMDAHNKYPKDYISKCVKYLNEYRVDNVGGIWITLPGADTLIAQAIAKATSCGFGVGNVSYKLGVKEPTYVETVPFGCFFKKTFDKVGLFDEDMVRAQDSELNHRIIKNGGKILLVPDIVSYYYARETFRKMVRMYSQYGYFKAFTAVKLGGVFTVRQFIPALFVASVLFLSLGSIFYTVFGFLLCLDIGAYLLANIVASVKLSFGKDWRLFPLLVWAFILIHFTFGFNYLRGILDFWILRKHLRIKLSDLPVTR
ncbi:MAG: glycosyltransferase [Candidatus Omnitrophota bacterium]